MPSEFMKSYMIGFVDFEGLGGKMQLDFVLDVLNDELGFGLIWILLVLVIQLYMFQWIISDSTIFT